MAQETPEGELMSLESMAARLFLHLWEPLLPDFAYNLGITGEKIISDNTFKLVVSELFIRYVIKWCQMLFF